MDLDLWDCFQREKTHIAEFDKIDLDILGHPRNGKTLFYSSKYGSKIHLNFQGYHFSSYLHFVELYIYIYIYI